ncbi:MAG TPA: NUDIX domain-containing protein [Candidatus Paceibacterota bacterium]
MSALIQVPEDNYKYCPHCAKSLGIRVKEDKERKYCSSCRWTHYPVEGIAPCGIIIKNGNVLLVQRNREPFKGLWQLTSGFKDQGETIMEALIRELKEELAIDLVDSRFLREVVSYDDPRSGGVLVQFFYIANHIGTPRNNEPEENSSISYWPLKNLPPMAWRSHLETLNMIIV